MTITFTQIPADRRVPGTLGEIDGSLAGKAPPNHAVYIVGIQKGGTGVELTQYNVTDPTKAEGLFGQGSQLSLMIHAARAQNRNVKLVAIPQDEDAGGTAASNGKLAWTGPATSAGVIHLYIGAFFGTSKLFGRVRVVVAAGDTAAEIAQKAVDAITDDAQLPVTAALNVEDTDLTCKWKGAAGNDIVIVRDRFEGDDDQSPAGVGLTITQFSNGLADPDVSDALAAIGSSAPNTLICGYRDATTAAVIALWAEGKWLATTQQEVVAFMSTSGSLGTMLAFGAARNDRTLVFMGTHNATTPTWIWSAAVGMLDAGLCAADDNSRPRQRYRLYPCIPTEESAALSDDERDQLLKSGISTHYASSSGYSYCERLITTYQKTPDDIPDTAYLNIMTMRTLAALRQSVRSHFTTKYPNHNLGDDGSEVAGLAIMTPQLGFAEMITLYEYEWVPRGLVEKAGLTQFQEDLIVERDLFDVDRLNIQHSPDLLNALILVAHKALFRL